MSKHYSRMSVAEKAEHNRQHALPDRCPVCEIGVNLDDYLAHRARCSGRPKPSSDIPIRCPDCGVAVAPADYPGHGSRCCGRADPDRLDRWVSLRAALSMGAKKRSLTRWAADEKVRTRLVGGMRLYLLRDLVKCVVAVPGVATVGHGCKHSPKELTKSEPKGYPLRMGAAPNELRKRINAYAAKVGGFAKAARKMDVPTNTLKRAVSGKAIRDGSVLHIEAGLKEVGA